MDAGTNTPAQGSAMTSCPARHDETTSSPLIAVVIPCYRVTAHILDVVSRIGPECRLIYVVDDCCPDGSGDFVARHASDSRIRIVRNPTNLGVGGAVLAGYRAAIHEGAEILVKIDGDGQMPPELIRRFVAPITAGIADYTKGNRFFDLAAVQCMPTERVVGNAVLSFVAKFSTGYWHIFDPTNGYTAIHARVAAHLPFERISRRYFFESDLLFRLNTLRAVVVDVPMVARYGDEVSNLRIRLIIGEFLRGHLRNFAKRIFYNHFLRDLSPASLQLVLGAILLAAGTTFGLIEWHELSEAGATATAGTVMLAALPVLLGIQLLLAFLMWDMQSTPRLPIHPYLAEQPDVGDSDGHLTKEHDT